MVLFRKVLFRFIQSKQIYQDSPTSIDPTAKKFKNFTFTGKINAALRHPESAS